MSRSGKECGTSTEAQTSIEVGEGEKARALFGRVEYLNWFLHCNIVAV
jgi:hypothetical protein